MTRLEFNLGLTQSEQFEYRVQPLNPDTCQQLTGRPLKRNEPEPDGYRSTGQCTWRSIPAQALATYQLTSGNFVTVEGLVRNCGLHEAARATSQIRFRLEANAVSSCAS